MSEAQLPLPRGMTLLGWSGTLPFIATVGIAALEPGLRSSAVAAFIAYGAVILSFLGGTRWGSGVVGAAHPLRFLESVIPSLLAFAALLLVQMPHLALLLLGAGFLVWALIDTFDPRWPQPYRRMRLAITGLVLALHAAWLVI